MALTTFLPTDTFTGAPARPLRPCLFLDKDGTLIENVPYNVDPAKLRFMPGAGEALAQLREAGLSLVIVTNQAGIAKGLFTRAQFARLQEVLLRRLQEEFGVVIDDVAVCPHSPDAKGRPACLCRKPAPGMLIRAARAHHLDLARSWMVGDILDDVEAGHRAGARGLLFDSGGETEWRRSPLREPTATFTSWPALAAHLLEAMRSDGTPGASGTTPTVSSGSTPASPPVRSMPMALLSRAFLPQRNAAATA
ncbi:hypothetical protein CDN98_05845 [Roseateles terrae]|nr:hypothetical protein CDN98_05845 [Roseateles terrae]